MEKTIHHSSQQPQLMKNTYHLTFREEVGNAVSHGVMMFLYLFALPFLSVYAYLQDGWIGVVGMGIYGICMIAMFGGSCLYHIMPYDTKWKFVFRKLDHISILLAIAGTYTPICLGIVDHYMLKIVLAVEWLLAIVGILLKSISKYAHPAISYDPIYVYGLVSSSCLTDYHCSNRMEFRFLSFSRWFMLHNRRHLLCEKETLLSFHLAFNDCGCFLNLPLGHFTLRLTNTSLN